MSSGPARGRRCYGPRQMGFVLTLPYGLCAAIDAPDAIDATGADALHPEERRHAEALAETRRRDWVGGRLALRRAVGLLGGVVLEGPIVADDRGAPRLPPGLVGSISHKDGLAVALVAAAEGAAIGVDLERWQVPRRDLSKRVLVEAELAELSGLPDDERGRAVLLRFSIKEAIYKAIDPYLRRYVGFREVAVQPAGDGSCAVDLLCGDGADLRVEACWRVHEGRLLTAARARRT
jgi:4'-phosphopantetheinyl transferase EntD